MNFNYGLKNPFIVNGKSQKPAEPLFIDDKNNSIANSTQNIIKPLTIEEQYKKNPQNFIVYDDGTIKPKSKASLVPGVGIVPNSIISAQPQMYKKSDKSVDTLGKLGVVAALLGNALPTKGIGQISTGIATKLPGANIIEAGVNKARTLAPKAFSGLKNLSTKLIEDLKGKITVPKSYIEQRLVSSDLNLKQVEKDLIRNQLLKQPGNIDVSKFAEKVQDELLPLTIKKPIQSRGFDIMEKNRYERISLPQELRGNVLNYAEHIYESPIKTSAGDVHWNGITNNYFGHTRVEDLADSSLDKALRKQGGTRRVIEVQSDLFQRGRLENEVKNRINETGLVEPEGYVKMMKENGYDKKQIQDWENKIPEYKKTVENIKKEVEKLQQYNDPTAHFRMVREEVKLAAQDGKTKLQFPTGETAMKIEGLGQNADNWVSNGHRINNLDELIVGKEVAKVGEQDSWIITDVLEDGKFKAVPKNVDLSMKSWEIKDDGKVLVNKQTRASYIIHKNETAEDIIKEINSEMISQNSEQFDISGKVDTNNPIYKFYEKDLGKYLTSKYQAKTITDPRGVKWFELDIKPEMAKKPVEAFGFSSLQQMVKTGLITGGALAAQDIVRDKLGSKRQEKTAQSTPEIFIDKVEPQPNTINNQKNVDIKKPENLNNNTDINKYIEDYVKEINVIINKNGANLGNTLAEENNNPGNLRFAGQPNAEVGRAGFAKFPSPEIGFRALIKDVQSKQSKGLTLSEMINIYSPPSENDTKLYIDTLSKWLGINKNDKISKISPIELAKAIARFESQTEVN